MIGLEVIGVERAVLELIELELIGLEMIGSQKKLYKSLNPCSSYLLDFVFNTIKII